MDKALLEKEKQRLADIVAEEKRSYHLLALTLDGYCHAEVDCRNIAITSQWIENDEVFSVPTEKVHGLQPITLRGEVATKIVMKALDLLENDIRFHEKQLKEL